MVDHFEPSHGKATRAQEREIMQRLISDYPMLANKHKDSSGNRPTRTWFFPPHDHRHGNLRELVALCQSGYGEVELHLHHGKTKPDTDKNLERTIRLCVDEYSRFGIFGTEGGRKKYGFIHGDWALANSRKDGRFCGVDNELQVLATTGCYADFTFPSCDECNPSQINTVFYMQNGMNSRKQNGGPVAKVGRDDHSGLMIIQGPLHPIFMEGRRFALRAFGDDVTNGKPATRKRLDLWIRTWIHVQGKSDWVFIKCHTHGATDGAVVLGPEMDETFSCLEEEYNDGRNFSLHYVTARELYNIIKAAEAGENGDPEQYRDYRVSKPIYDGLPCILQASSQLRELVYSTYAD